MNPGDFSFANPGALAWGWAVLALAAHVQQVPLLLLQALQIWALWASFFRSWHVKMLCCHRLKRI